ncbi:AIPR family protein [Roseovarius nitratireducens]|uniref:AIPR family protein n=1 Tax=Roseovarius nitratireducens TaxID=2044597 RepID=UPI0023E87ABC|nr:AIPR family protein [Roseovarius nitratireducens]
MDVAVRSFARSADKGGRQRPTCFFHRFSSDASKEVGPFISKYANSQNKVSAADFFSNHPFHMRMEE